MKTPPALIERAKAGDPDAAIEWGANVWRVFRTSAHGEFLPEPPEHPTMADIDGFFVKLMADVGRRALEERDHSADGLDDAILAAIGRRRLGLDKG